jgi:hypothetical protein
MVLTGPALQAPQKIALHRGGSNALASAQTASVHAVQVLLINHLLEALAGSLARLNAWQLLAEHAATIQTAALAHPQVHNAPPETPVVVADQPAARAFVAQTRASALGTRYRPSIPGRYRNRAAIALDVANLVKG